MLYVNLDVVGYNTNLVPAAEAPKTWDDLTNPKWKGKIMLPTGSISDFAALREHKYGGDLAKTRAYYEEVAKNEPQLMEGPRQMSDLLAAGQNAIFMGASVTQLYDLKRNGAPVDWAKEEGVVDPNVAGIVKNAPHPNASKLFINWLISEEGQTAMANMNRLTARPGIKGEVELIPLAMKLYVNSPDLAVNAPEHLRLFNQIFGLR
jgi:iron(III) transport system substrate-binding protein